MKNVATPFGTETMGGLDERERRFAVGASNEVELK